MNGTLELEKLTLPKISPATDAEIVAYLRRSGKVAEIAVQVEQENLMLELCEQFNITASDDEWQAAGDAFRLEHQLLGITETQAWLEKQRISVEEWSQGIKVSLLTTKLKEHLFGMLVDSHYIANRDSYRRVALSQVLVTELSEAVRLVRSLQENSASFCTLALTHSKGKQSQENGGFVGVRFVSELAQEISQAIADAQEGEVVGPVQTKLGYHVLRVEKWFPTELNEAARKQILTSLFQVWLHEQSVAKT